jgi:hypothetical protein
MIRRLTFLAVSFLVALCISSTARAQTTGTISGFINDSGGAVITGASVTLTEQRTGASRTLNTDNTGHFVENLLPVGIYTVDVKAAGFQEQRRTGINLEAQASPQITVTMLPASVEQTVVVETEQAELETTDATLGQTIHSAEVADLPLNGRDFVQLALLTPGVSAGQQPTDFFSGTAESSSEVSIRGSYSLSVGGSRENATDWLLDGIDNNELTAGGISILPSPDALAEFNVLTYNYSTRYGARSGPTVLLTTKSGTNKFHGTLFDFLRNTGLNAYNYTFPGTTATRAEYIQNQFGGSVGGPIIKNKTFVFFDYQGTRNVQGIPSYAQVPTMLERQGNFTENFASSDGLPQNIYDPYTQERTQFGFEPGGSGTANVMTTAELNTASGKIATKMLALFPKPNVSDSNGVYLFYSSTPRRTLTDNEFDIRIDHKFRDADQVFARFSRDQARVADPSGLPDFGTQPYGWVSNQVLEDHGRNAALSETHVFSSSKVNQASIGYNRIFNHILSYGDGTNWNDQLGIPNANVGTLLSTGLMNTDFSNGYYGLGDRGFSPFQGGSQIYHYVDDFEWVHGAHSLSMGGEMRFDQMNVMGAAFPMGKMSFDNNWTADSNLDSTTGNPVASFLLGLPASVEHDNAYDGIISGRRWKMFRPYLQDNWTVRRNLTVQLGLAYNYTTPVVEAQNRQSNFDVATGTLLIAGKNGTNAAGGLKKYWKGFEPRIGFSYSPFSEKNVIRGGYSILHDSGWNLGSRGLTLNPPFYSSYTYENDDSGQPVSGTTQTLAGGFPDPSLSYESGTTADSLNGSVYGENLNNHPGMVQQFNLGGQRQLPGGVIFTAAYVGARSSHLQTMDWNLDSAPPNTVGSDPQSLRPFPNSQLTDINEILDRGQARYDSLQVKVEKTAHRGLYVLLSYTYSKGLDNGLMDDLSSMVGADYYPFTTSDGTTPLPPHVDKGLSDINSTNNFAASMVYQLPFGKGQRFAGGVNGIRQQVVGNWQFNLISHMTSGVPMGLESGGYAAGIDYSTNNVRPNQTCKGKISHQSVSEFFDTSCFPDPAAGTLGLASRTPINGPDFINFDASLFKDFMIYAGTRLQFRTESFNILNHPQFALPGATTDSPYFGKITATVNNPRLIQFALKLVF